MARHWTACLAVHLLAGVAAADDAPARVYSSSWATWIRPRPSRTGQELGYVRPGASLRLRQSERVTGPGCAGGWVAVEPRGFVCLDRHATLDAGQRWVRAMQLSLPRDGTLPYRYALSNGAPMYGRLPTRDVWLDAERRYGPAGSFRPQYWGNRGHERLAEQRLVEPDSAPPFFLTEAPPRQSVPLVRRQIPHGSMLSFTRAFRHADRTWLLSADGTIVPADRVRPYRESTFAGKQLAEHDLPLLWIRGNPQPKYVRGHDGDMHQTSESWPIRGAVPIDATAPPHRLGRAEYLKTRERNAEGRELYVASLAGSLIKPEVVPPRSIGAADKWLRISITQGALVAYQGSRAVFTTLISPGAGGVPVKGQNPVKASTTPLGTYRITFKHLTDDMSPEQGDQRSFWLADVPYTQYFDMPFALHAAYWHEDFGEPMSAGCVNLSPRDARWLFGWTDPPLPADWHGVVATPETGRGTLIVIVR